jgi:asparagine synthase (glutamine-hydrolysing)
MSAILQRMAGSLAHRGPDGQDIWLDGETGIGFAHRRLAIIDLSDAGRQPMTSHDGRFVLTFNGEIYNYRELRAALPREHWRGASDTEVLLEWIAQFGIEETLSAANGMFAFAVWDRRDRCLTLARDAFGEKPLYYGVINGMLAFTSELKGFHQIEGFSRRVDPAAFSAYLRYGYVPAPLSIFQGVEKLAPAHFVTFTAPQANPQAARYWDCQKAALDAKHRPFEGDGADAEDMLDELLRDSVAQRMVSDVPLGCLLSGGIDSSLIAAEAQAAVNSTPLQTFTVSMKDDVSPGGGINEAGYARAVASVLNADHHEIAVSGAEAARLAPAMAGVFDELFADSSQVPTYLISQFARRHVTVALSGDGGDELFGGYNRYVQDVWPRAEKLPLSARRLASASLQALAPSAWDQLIGKAPWMFPKELRAGASGDKVHKLAGALASTSENDYHETLLSLIPDSQKYMGAPHRSETLSGRAQSTNAFAFAERAMLLDTTNYLPDDVLVKTDRASMAHGLELRAPFLDRRLFSFAWRLPLAQKISKGRGKLPLRSVLSRYVPNSVFERPKQGFAVPVGRWLREDLRPWAAHLLDEKRLRQTGLLNPDAVTPLWQAHLSGRRNFANQLWVLLMAEAWAEQWNATL